MAGHLAEIEQVVEVDFREGSATPNKENLEFIKKCEAALPVGVSIRHLRADAATYQAGVINYCECQRHSLCDPRQDGHFGERIDVGHQAVGLGAADKT